MVLRRVPIEYRPRSVPVHAYVGRMDPSYTQGVLEPAGSDACTYESYGSWLSNWVKGGGLLLLAPGPQLLSTHPQSLLHQVSSLALADFSKRSRTHFVAKVGRSLVGDSHHIPLALERMLARRTLTYGLRSEPPRTFPANYFRMAPDLAYASGFVQEALRSQVDGPYERPTIALSFRQDNLPPVAALKALINLIYSEGHDPVFIAQVRSDNSAMATLAHRFGASSLLWSEEGHTSHLQKVLAVYSSSTAIYTNRLHAAIFASMAGAAVVSWTSHEDRKIESCLGRYLPNMAVASYEEEAPRWGQQSSPAVLQDLCTQATAAMTAALLPLQESE